MLIFAGSLFSAAALIGHAPPWLIYVLLLRGGCCRPFLTGGLTSQLPALVGRTSHRARSASTRCSTTSQAWSAPRSPA